MALGKAVIVGAFAAMAVPWVMRDEPGAFGEWIQTGVMELSLGGTAIRWSWPLFIAVTLFAWGFLAWADR